MKVRFNSSPPQFIVTPFLEDSIVMDWEEVEERLIEIIGPNYQNYPACVEWNLKVMAYMEKLQTEKTD